MEKRGMPQAKGQHIAKRTGSQLPDAVQERKRMPQDLRKSIASWAPWIAYWRSRLDDFVDLRTQALDHQDCNCQIGRYNIRQVKIVALSASAQSSPLQYEEEPATTTMTTMAKGGAGEIPPLDDFMFRKPCNHRINSCQQSP
jgi:hypothetical protein